MPSQIATFLGLSEPETYTGHSYRRSGATMMANSGATITDLKRMGDWGSTSVAEGNNLKIKYLNK